MTALDAALLRLQPYGCVLHNGLSNHAPMVAEVLSRRAPESVLDWVDAEVPRLAPRPGRQGVPADEALGEPDRFSDWAARFRDSLEAEGIDATLQTWVERLAPGFAAAAAHGVIRVGHAVHALRRADTEARRYELADALASWASELQALPVQHGGPRDASPAETLRAVALLPRSRRRPRGSITRALGQLPDEFGEHFDRVDLRDPERATLEAARVFARLFVRSALDHSGAIVFTHALTGLLAVTRLAPVLQPSTHRRLLRHALHTGFALHAVYSREPYAEPALPEARGGFSEALAHGDEHVIKLADAVIDLHARTGDPFLLALPGQAMSHIPPRRRG